MFIIGARVVGRCVSARYDASLYTTEENEEKEQGEGEKKKPKTKQRTVDSHTFTSSEPPLFLGEYCFRRVLM